MNIVLWTLQVLLAGIFFGAGYVKIFKPEKMKAQGLSDVGLLLFIGMSELLGSGGLILPWVTRILPWLTPLAALGTAVIMVLAARFHLKRHEARAAALTFVLMSLSLFVACGRFFLSPRV
jgi:hypothetical protein